MPVTENTVEMSLAGNPRWWTLTNKKGTREIVRAVFDIKETFPDVEDDLLGQWPNGEAVIYILLKPGQFKWPPLAATAMKLGKVGIDNILQRGGTVSFYPEPLAKKLELQLVGFK